MTSMKPTLSSAGCVKPWIQKFTNTPRDSFFDQFVDSRDARFVEIIEGSHESEIKYSEVPLDSNNPKSAPDLSKVFELPQQDGSKGILRLIILPFNTENDNAPPLSWKGFREQLDLLHLENTFISTEQMQTPPTWFEVPLQAGLKGFVLKPERWDSNLANFSISAVHSPASRVTHVVAHMLHKTDIKHLLLRLQTLKGLAWHPLLVPLILMEQRIEGTAENLLLMRDSLYSVEKRTGTHKNYRNDKYHEDLNHYAYGDKVWERRHDQDVDFDAAPGKITSIASECAMTEAKCEVNESLLDWLQGLNDSLDELNTDSGSWKRVKSSIMMKISAFKTWSGNNRARSIYLAKRAEAQMQAASSQKSQKICPLSANQT
ncbi:hypothetical protein FANTH_10120 [Fusarium anthophilum]|uniref:Uncharacterized protein n=1 Tax=Fusarium anthophilum TaxID=48485 RepID=A0A8H4Z2A8_9HYPO|nr:hypothetical protein FANTH_10120 [Fusarium anthophilum]